MDTRQARDAIKVMVENSNTIALEIPKDCHQKSNIIPWNLETKVHKGKISYLQPGIVWKNHGITMSLKDSESEFRETSAVLNGCEIFWNVFLKVFIFDDAFLEGRYDYGTYPRPLNSDWCVYSE